MQASDLLTAAFAAQANSETGTLILKRCGPYWLFCTDTEPRVQRFLGDRFIDSFDPPSELPEIFAALECHLVSPGEASTSSIIPWCKDSIVDVESLSIHQQHDWRRVCETDLDSLSPGKWLNDVVINEYVSRYVH
jgi:hypothetical protein